MNLEEAEKFRQQKREELEEAGEPTSDGCTFAPELGTPCCETHDYLRRFKPDGMKAREADKLLRQCIAKKGHPVFAWIYWAFVRASNLFGFYS
jgi:hypothetical protein